MGIARYTSYEDTSNIQSKKEIVIGLFINELDEFCDSDINFSRIIEIRNYMDIGDFLDIYLRKIIMKGGFGGVDYVLRFLGSGYASAYDLDGLGIAYCKDVIVQSFMLCKKDVFFKYFPLYPYVISLRNFDSSLLWPSRNKDMYVYMLHFNIDESLRKEINKELNRP